MGEKATTRGQRLIEQGAHVVTLIRPPQHRQQFTQRQDVAIDGILQIGDAVGDVIGRLHDVDQWMTATGGQPQALAKSAIKRLLAEEDAALAAPAVMLAIAHPGLRLLRVFAQRSQLPQSEIELVQAVHQPQALGIAIEQLQILAQLRPLGRGRLCQRLLIERLQRFAEPLAHHLFAKVTERRVAHIVQQARHLHQIDKGPLANHTGRQGGQNATTDLAAGLLHLQRVSEAATHRGLHIQRKDLSLLLQTAHRRRLHDAGAILLGRLQQILLPPGVNALGGNQTAIHLVAPCQRRASTS